MIVLVILWTCVGLFIATSIISVFGLVNIIKIDKKYMNALFASIILEVAAIGIGIFSGKINPDHLVSKARDTGEREAYERLSKDIDNVLRMVRRGLEKEDYDTSSANLRYVFDEIIGKKVSVLADTFYLKGLLEEKRYLWDEATQSFETSLAIKPDNPEVLVHVGRTCSKLKDYEKSKEYYSYAMQLARSIGDRNLEYRIANGLQNVERRFGAFLLEVDRRETADLHFNNALKIIQSMEVIRPTNHNDVLEKRARYRIFWEWKKYDEAIAEVKALINNYEELEYKEDLCSMLIEAGDERQEEAYDILKRLFVEGNITNYSIASLAEVASTLEKNEVYKSKILDHLNRAIVADDPINRDPYLYYVKALLLKSLSKNKKAIESIEEAIRLEKYRSRNIYTFDPTRLELYQRKHIEWTTSSKKVASQFTKSGRIISTPIQAHA